MSPFLGWSKPRRLFGGIKEMRLAPKFVIAIILFSLLALVLPASVAKAGEMATEAWVARYDGPISGFDHARDIAVDSLGNVYVTGWSASTAYSTPMGYDYATVKYDTNGNEQWVARYNGPANGEDEACAIAVDSAGNVYVTGSSHDGHDWDYVTIKYDTSGNQLWLARYDGPASDYDYAQDMAIDSSGNVYVTGWSEASSTDWDYATVKYDTNGNEQWVARYNGPANRADEAYAIAVDSAGNVYVTGYSIGTNRDYATVKYDTAGNELWVARYDSGEGFGSDVAHDITVDASGNVYVTGTTAGNQGYATIKYNNDGTQLWVARYEGSTTRTEFAEAIAVDGLGNAYVTGWLGGGGTNGDYVTVKYDTDGNELWVDRYDASGDDYACALALDNSGYIYVTGSSGKYALPGRVGSDYATIKYDTNGNRMWVARYDGSPDTNMGPCAIVVDNLGNIYVTGEDWSSSTCFDYATIKYTQAAGPTPTPTPEGCFIATAAYGTSSAAELDTLRAFRDEVLLQNGLGSQLVAFYYEVSPPVADFISEHQPLRTLVRELLVDPVVWVVEAIESFWRD